jgi:hypothetical protein
MVADTRSSQEEEQDVGVKDEREANSGESAAIAVFGEQGYEEVELLLNGDTPEWVHRIEANVGRHGSPIAEHDNGPSGPGDFSINMYCECDDREANCEADEIERPDAQNATKVELAEMNLASRLALTQKQLSNKESAECEKQGESESAGRDCVDEYMSKAGWKAGGGRNRINIQRVVGKDEEESEKADDIELGAVVAADEGRRGYRASSVAGGRSRFFEQNCHLAFVAFRRAGAS